MEVMDIFNTTLDDPLDSVLSLSPPESNEFDDASLFQNLTDFIDNEGVGLRNKTSEYGNMSSDSEHSVIDVDIQDDISLDVVNHSEGDEELVRYLTENGKPIEIDNNNTNDIKLNEKRGVKSVFCTSNKGYRVDCSDKEPIVVSGKHSVIRIPQNSTIGSSKLFTKVKILKNDQTELHSLGPSSPSGSVTSSKGNCLSKSALAARENREKKKKYISQLEANVHDFGKENKTLKFQVKELDKEVEELRNEVAYLKSVLVNQSTLSKLLKNIPGVTGVRLTSSENKTHSLNSECIGRINNNMSCKKSNTSDVKTTNLKRLRVDDHDYATSKNNVYGESILGSSKKLKLDENQSPRGVCLHVVDGDVSLEFCALCSEKSSKAKK